MGKFFDKIQKITEKNIYHDENVLQKAEFKKILKEIKYLIKQEAKKGHNYYVLRYQLKDEEIYKEIFDYLEAEGFTIKEMQRNWLIHKCKISW